MGQLGNCKESRAVGDVRLRRVGRENQRLAESHARLPGLETPIVTAAMPGREDDDLRGPIETTSTKPIIRTLQREACSADQNMTSTCSIGSFDSVHVPKDRGLTVRLAQLRRARDVALAPSYEPAVQVYRVKNYSMNSVKQVDDCQKSGTCTESKYTSTTPKKGPFSFPSSSCKAPIIQTRDAPAATKNNARRLRTWFRTCGELRSNRRV